MAERFSFGSKIGKKEGEQEKPRFGFGKKQEGEGATGSKLGGGGGFAAKFGKSAEEKKEAAAPTSKFGGFSSKFGKKEEEKKEGEETPKPSFGFGKKQEGEGTSGSKFGGGGGGFAAKFGKSAEEKKEAGAPTSKFGGFSSKFGKKEEEKKEGEETSSTTKSKFGFGKKEEEKKEGESKFGGAKFGSKFGKKEEDKKEGEEPKSKFGFGKKEEEKKEGESKFGGTKFGSKFGKKEEEKKEGEAPSTTKSKFGFGKKEEEKKDGEEKTPKLSTAGGVSTEKFKKEFEGRSARDILKSFQERYEKHYQMFTDQAEKIRIWDEKLLDEDVKVTELASQVTGLENDCGKLEETLADTELQQKDILKLLEEMEKKVGIEFEAKEPSMTPSDRDRYDSCKQAEKISDEMRELGRQVDGLLEDVRSSLKSQETPNDMAVIMRTLNSHVNAIQVMDSSIEDVSSRLNASKKEVASLRAGARPRF